MTTYTLNRSNFQYGKDQFPSLSQTKSTTPQKWGPSTGVRYVSKNKSFTQKFKPKKKQKGHSIECAYCHEVGHHIKYCEKAANATARKQKARQQQFQLKKTRSVEQLRQQVITTLEQSNLPVVIASKPVKAIKPVKEIKPIKAIEEPVNSNEPVISRELLIEKINKIKEEIAISTIWADKCDLEDELEDLEKELN